jgi:ribosomal protein S18 acetylase RimI-like enzyme
MKIADNRIWDLERVERFLKKKEKIMLIAETKHKRVVGFLGFKKYEEMPQAKKFLDFTKYSHVAWIAIHPDFRKQGIGTLLMNESEKYNKEFKKAGIWLDCRESKIPFYKKLGYKVLGNYMDKDKEKFVLLKRL